MIPAQTKCEACGERIPVERARTDNDGFTACYPAFPRSETDDRPMRGKCFMRKPGAGLLAAAPQGQNSGEGEA